MYVHRMGNDCLVCFRFVFGRMNTTYRQFVRTDLMV